MERDSMVFYRSFYEAIRELPNEQRLEAFDAITSYGIEGKEYQGDGVVKAIYMLIKPQIDANNARYKNGKAGGRPPKPKKNQKETKEKPNRNQSETKHEPNENVNVNENEKETLSSESVKKKCEAPSPFPPFSPPTLDEVREYCEQSGNLIDCEHFFDHYSSTNWTSNGNPIVDWKAKVRSWYRQDMRSEKARSLPSSEVSNKPVIPPTRFHNFTQRNTDYDLILHKLNQGRGGGEASREQKAEKEKL